jgi:hypothetical protein
MPSLSPQVNSLSKNAILFFVPAARPANESESTLEGPTTTEVAVLPADETQMRSVKEARWIESTLLRVV